MKLNRSLLFSAIWGVQWVRFEKDRIVLANPFSRNLKSIEYSDMELDICWLSSPCSDGPPRRNPKQLYICIYSKKYHPRRYRFCEYNYFGKHRMHIYYDHDMYERLKKLAEENSKEIDSSSS